MPFSFVKFTRKTATILWEKLGDIPIDTDEQIKEEFLHFPVGTHRETIWHWFEEQFDLSINELMFPEKQNE